MINYKTSISLIIMVVGCLSANAQLVNKVDSLEKATELSLDLKLHYRPISLTLSASHLVKDTRNVYIYNQAGMYEQFIISPSDTHMLRPYKAYVPSGIVTINGDNRKRDSFNPHGSDNIGSAILNGLLNGILFGNEY